MNERVWLQSKVTFVNTKLAISLGFLATFLTFSCSPNENSAETAVEQPNTVIEEAQTMLPSLPIIWESKPASGPIVDLAIGKSASNAYYITAILEDGSAESFDLDGIPIARSEPGLFREIAGSSTLKIQDSHFIAHVATNFNDEISVMVISPKNGKIGAGAASPSNFKVEKLCSGNQFQPVPTNNDIEFFYQINGSYFIGNITLSTDIPELTNIQPISGDRVSTTCSNSNASLVRFNDEITELEITDQKFLLTTKEFLEAESTPKKFTLREGMSVSAPDKLIAMDHMHGFISQDYPEGLIAFAGKHSDENFKLSFLSAKSIWENYDKDRIESSKALTEADLQNLEAAIETLENLSAPDTLNTARQE